jgi:myo-inositol-1(or 4)-monophosphatase
MSLVDPLMLATAVETVVKAGATQLEHLGRVHVEKKGEIDLVTEVDLAIERAFRAVVAERFPDHVVLGEELSSGDPARSGSRFCWVFDPLDGTTNYAHGLPIFCSSLALEVDGLAVLGAVYDPTRRELFTAERGQGARLNGQPLRVSAARRVLDSMLCTGFPYDVHQSRDEIVGLFGEFVGRARAVRRLGSAALDLCYVAAGRLDGFWEQRLKPWDTAAGALVVEEAGGRVTDWTGGTYQSRCDRLVASNGLVHDEILGIIDGYYRQRDGAR